MNIGRFLNRVSGLSDRCLLQGPPVAWRSWARSACTRAFQAQNGVLIRWAVDVLVIDADKPWEGTCQEPVRVFGQAPSVLSWKSVAQSGEPSAEPARRADAGMVAPIPRRPNEAGTAEGRRNG